MGKRLFKLAVKLFVSFLMAIVMLSGISLFYKHTSMHVPSLADETYFRWEPDSFTATMEEGFAWVKMDQNGYNNMQCFDSIDILIMGSSHMEAVQINSEDNTASRMNELLPYNTYSIGVSSHSFIHCVNNLKSAIKLFNPRNYIIIETSNLSLDTEEMNCAINRQLEPSSGPDTGIKKIIQYIPAAKPILNQLLEWINVSGNNKEADQLKNENIEEYLQVLYSFLNIIHDDVKDTGITPIIMYHPSETLSEDGSVHYKTNLDDLQMFAQACEDLGIIFVDMTPDFEKMYEEKHILAHGFINTAVGTGHLNKYGHKAIAERLAEVIGGEN